jgi:hypothetical protein
LSCEKESSRRNYKYKEGSLLPVLNTDDPDCSVEITKLNPANNKAIVWWNIGIDLFAGKNISKDERKYIKVIAQLLLSDYSETNLESARSYGYPKLFSLNRNHITEGHAGTTSIGRRMP